MSINRNTLIRAITDARSSKNDELYNELIHIYYNMLEQEEINDDYITDFITFGEVSESAKKVLAYA